MVALVYDLPFGANRRFSAQGFWNKLIGGWYTSGIVQARSGVPLLLSQGSGIWGGGVLLGNAVGAVATTDVSKFGNNINGGVTGSNGVGTTSNPATKGTGLNLFADPEAVYNSFRHVRLSEDTRDGRGALRGAAQFDLDLSMGKRTEVLGGDHPVSMTFTFDFLNAFNHVYWANPSLVLTNKAAFGAITTQANTPRAIQVGLRFDF